MRQPRKLVFPDASISAWRNKFADSSATNRSRETSQSAQVGSRASVDRRIRTRSFNKKQKIAITAEFNALVKNGVRHEIALKRVGVSYSSISRWRKKYASFLESDQQRRQVGSHTRSIETNRTKNLNFGPTSPKSTPKAMSDKASRKAKRYSTRKRNRILKEYNSLRESGTNAHEAAKKLGVSYFTIRSWEKKKGVGRRPRTPGTAKPITPRDSSGGGLGMVLPSGNRIEGLTFEQVVELVKITQEVSSDKPGDVHLDG